MPSYFTITPSSETGTKNITITAQPFSVPDFILFI